MTGARALSAIGSRGCDAQRAALLPWESAEAFDALARDFQNEFRPSGPTEHELVARLVWIAWRRRRLVLAERAVHVASLSGQLSDTERIAKRAGVRDRKVIQRMELAEVVTGDADGDVADREARTEDRKGTERALKLLATGDYAKAVAALHPDTRGWWEDALAGDANDERAWAATAEDLKTFLAEVVAPVDDTMDGEIEARPGVRLQAFGESLDPDRLERLLAIDTRLDRQFEKALSMLIQLQRMRVSKPAKSAPVRG